MSGELAFGDDGFAWWLRESVLGFWGLSFRAQFLVFRVQGLGVSGFGLTCHGTGFRLQRL